jgi:parallel beta-helix repeat protein
VTGGHPYRSRFVGGLLVAVGAVGLALTVGVFLVDASDRQPDPVPFDQAASFDIPTEDRRLMEDRGLSIPRVQVFYSQYPYVVGYEGVERAVDVMHEPAHSQQFGHPTTVYVSDYAGTGVTVTDDGYLDPGDDPTWVSADEAWFVLDSGARTTVSESIVPFGEESAARAFADRHGGSVERWSNLDPGDVELADASAVRERVPERHERADRRLAAVEPRLDRPVSVVVGEDAPTVQAAVDAAPPETTVLLPPGAYDEHVRVDRPVTLRGEGATLRGNGTGTVVNVTHDRAALADLTITGVGNTTNPENTTADDDWDGVVAGGYGYADAGVYVVGAANVSIHGVTVETPASGVVYRDSPEGVVDNLTVDGRDTAMEGFMGLVSIRSPLVVQESTFENGRDGTYLHRAGGSVLRDNTFRGNRFGVHLMYTSNSLIANNTARNLSSAGVTIMTNPTRNAVVDNDIRGSAGIAVVGSRSYVADNVIADNTRGLLAGTTQSLYEHNVVYGNELGVRSGATIPSNTLRENDFVANEEHARAGVGPLRVWTDGSTGNYWEGVHGGRAQLAAGGSYSPTDPVESQLHQTDGAVTLAASPAATALAEVRTTSAGLREGEIVDTAPLADPASPDVVERLRESDPGAQAGDPDDE